MLGLGLLFITGPIHFESGIARSEERIKEELSELLVHTDFDQAEREWKTQEIERQLNILIGSGRSMKHNNDAAAYAFFACGLLSLLSISRKNNQ